MTALKPIPPICAGCTHLARVAVRHFGEEHEFVSLAKVRDHIGADLTQDVFEAIQSAVLSGDRDALRDILVSEATRRAAVTPSEVASA